MKKLILVLNDLEGVGTTSCAQVIHALLRRKGHASTLVVTDPETDTDTCGAEFLDLAEGITSSDIIGLLDRSGIAVLDVYSEGAAILGEFFQEEEIGTLLSEIEAELTVVVTANDEVEGFEGIVGVAEAFADDADWVVVRTPVAAELPGDLEGSEAGRALEYLGALHVDMPEVAADTLSALEETGMSLGEALGRRKELPRFVRHALQGWELAFCNELAEAEEFLMPGRGAATSSPYRQRRGRVTLGS